MRYTAMPAWAYRLPIGIGAAFVVASIAFTFAGPQPGAKTIGPIWFLMDVVFVVVCVRALRGRKDEDLIRKTGLVATATLLGAKTSGQYLNGIPQWTFRLRIDGNGAPYETTLQVLTYTPADNGATFDVRVDPVRKEHVVLAGDDGVVAAKPPPAAPPAPDGMTSTINPDGSRTYTST
jgi:hypothetical protein